jgi:hypothetical protein
VRRSYNKYCNYNSVIEEEEEEKRREYCLLAWRRWCTTCFQYIENLPRKPATSSQKRLKIFPEIPVPWGQAAEGI